MGEVVAMMKAWDGGFPVWCTAMVSKFQFLAACQSPQAVKHENIKKLSEMFVSSRAV